MTWFPYMLAHHPTKVLSAITLFSLTCLIISLITIRLPNFKEPQLGFEARGTKISQRLIAWENLRRALQSSGSLTVLPSISNSLKQGKKTMSVHNNTQVQKGGLGVLHGTIKTLKKSSNISKLDFLTTGNSNFLLTMSAPSLATLDDELETLTSMLDSNNKLSHSNHRHQHDGEFFCSDPAEEYGRIVISGRYPHIDLFAVTSILDMCKLELMITSPDSYKDICATTSTEQNICRPWSLPNYITLISNKTTCLDINEEDLNKTKSLLTHCRQYYKDMTCLNRKMDTTSPCGTCRHLLDLIHYILDFEYLNETQTLKNVLVMLPIARSTGALQYYYDLEEMNLEMGDVQISAIDFGLKNALFDDQLLKDIRLIVAGGVFVLACIWIYTRSIFVTIMTVIAIIFSLVIAYFLYAFVFEINFFPFMNLLAVVVAVGVGGDIALMVDKMWYCAKLSKQRPKSIATLVQTVHSHSSICMVVTSLTTAVAFYSSYVSNITAICCFSMFAGTAVLSNLIVMMGWLPATMVIADKITCFPIRNRDNQDSDQNASSSAPCRLGQLLITAISAYPLLWIFLLATPVLLAPIVLFYHPGIRLPDSPDLQLFVSNHLFEQYDIVYRHQFWFERIQELDGWPDPQLELPLRFVWGVLPIDNGDHNDPLSRGTLQLDRSFDIASSESQVWLISFCKKLRSQSFFKPMDGPLLSNCFLENFIDWMKRKCDDPINKLSRAPCCESARFPFSRKVFTTCLALAANSLYNTPAQFITSEVAGPKFAKKTRNGVPKVKALVVEYFSNHSFTTSFPKMEKFFKQVEDWTQKEMASAPAGMRNGWFVSHLSLYDIQRSLMKETLAAILISTIASFVVVCLSTKDIFLSLAACLTVASVILVTVALLILFGWKLNIIEAIAVSLAIGLAVDFSIHYVINYRMAPVSSCGLEAAKYSVKMMSGPTFMAAITTAAIGVLMSPSSVLAYRQIGIFLIVVMCTSWTYATFFLMSLLALFGPKIPNNHENERFKHVDVGELGEERLATLNTNADNLIVGEHELIGLHSGQEGNRKAADNSSAAAATTILHDDD